MKTKILEKFALVHTPESMESLMQWIENLKSGERVVAMTAARMAWNLAAATLEAHSRRQEEERVERNGRNKRSE